jgi:hypothetical protein
MHCQLRILPTSKGKPQQIRHAFQDLMANLSIANRDREHYEGVSGRKGKTRLRSSFEL